MTKTRIQTDVALRWYLGLDLFDRVPDHSTISQLRHRKPTFRKIFRRLYEEVVGECIDKGLVSGRIVATDSTHVKANASIVPEELVESADGPGAYWERLDAYEEEGRKGLECRRGKKLRQGKQRTKCLKKGGRRSHKRVSRTGPGAGHMNRPGKPVGPHMDTLDKQLVELEKLVVAAYEDKVKCVIPEAVCVQLLKRYEDERANKLEQRTKLSAQLEACQEDEKAADDWLTMIRDYSKLEELDRPTLLRLVKRIKVGGA